MPSRSAPRSTPRHISVVAVANSTASTLFGIYDVLTYVERQSLASTGSAAFHVEIVGEEKQPLALASGVTVEVQRAIETIESSDILIVPSVYFGPDGWQTGRYPKVIDWIGRIKIPKAVTNLLGKVGNLFSVPTPVPPAPMPRSATGRATTAAAPGAAAGGADQAALASLTGATGGPQVIVQLADRKLAADHRDQVTQICAMTNISQQRFVFLIDCLPIRAVHLRIVEILTLNAPRFAIDLRPLGARINSHL